MCNYKGQRVSRSELLELLRIEGEDRDQVMRQRTVDIGFDYKPVDIIVPGEDHNWDLVEMEWGFIPPYWWNRDIVNKNRFGYYDEKGKWVPASIPLLNAKGETLLTSKVYRDAALNRRCLFPLTDFYEWQHVKVIGKRGKELKTPVKYPYRIGLRNQKIFTVAGIWQMWTDRETGETVPTCALVTTVANSLMRQIHNSQNRMPCILPNELAKEWVSTDLSEQRITEIATYQIPSNIMEAHTLPKDFLTASDPNEKYIYEDLPELVYS